MPTMKDVAELAGVSTTTVSHVINGTRYVSPELTEKVERAMEELDYEPNQLARSLKTQQTETIGLIVSDISNPFFSSLVRGVEDVSIENEHSLIVCNTDENLDKEELYVETLMRKKIDGLVIAPTGKEDQNLNKLSQNEVPIVFVDRKVEGIEADAVLSKNYEGAYELTETLIERGHSRIGIVLGRERVLTSKERFAGYRKALEDNGLEISRELIARGDFMVSGGMEATEELLDQPDPPTAVVAVNNQTLVGVVRALQEKGMSLYEDVDLASFDHLDWIDLFDVPVITAAQRPYEIGQQAARMLFKRVEKSKERAKKKRRGEPLSEEELRDEPVELRMEVDVEG